MSPTTGDMLFSTSDLKFFLTEDRLRIDRVPRTTVGVLERRTAVECWTPTEMWRGRLEGGAPPEVHKLTSFEYDEVIGMRSRSISSWTESRARAGEYLELVDFLLYIMKYETDVTTSHLEDSVFEIQSAEWGLDAHVSADNGELHFMRWRTSAAATTIEYTFVGRFTSDRAGARYPKEMYVKVVPDGKGPDAAKVSAFTFSEPNTDIDIMPEAFDWRTRHDKALLVATNKAERSDGTIVANAAGERAATRELPSDPLAPLMPDDRIQQVSRVLIAGFGMCLVIGLVIVCRRRAS